MIFRMSCESHLKRIDDMTGTNNVRGELHILVRNRVSSAGDLHLKQEGGVLGGRGIRVSGVPDVEMHDNTAVSDGQPGDAISGDSKSQCQ